MFGFFNRTKKKKAAPTIPPEALCVMVHRRSLLDAWLSQGVGTEHELAGAVTAGDAFAYTVALVGADGMVPLTTGQLEGVQMSFEEALSTGSANITSYILGQDASANDEGVVVIETEHGLAGAGLIANHFLLPTLGFDAPAVAMLPEENHLLLAPSNDPAALAAMLDMAERIYHGAPELRSLRTVCFSKKHVIEDWAPPDGHPLAQRFAAAAARTRELTARERFVALDGQKLASLAHLTARAAQDGGTLVASWARDSSMMLPGDLDRLVFLDTPDCAPHAVEMDFARALELLPSAFEALGESEEGEALFYRTRAPSFPSARVMAFLAASAAYEDAHPGSEDVEVDGDTLLEQWDRGEPIHFDTLSTDGIELRSATRQRATVSVDVMRGRVGALPATDRFHFVTGQLAVSAMSKMLDGDAAAFLEATLQAKPESDAILEAAAKERPALLSSLAAQHLIGEANEMPDQDGTDALMARTRAQQTEPTTLFPLLRSPGYEDASELNLKAYLKAQGHEPTQVTSPTPHGGALGAGFRFEIVADQGATRTALNHSTWHASAGETLVRTALLNLRAASIGALEKLDVGHAYKATWSDDYAASRLLIPDWFEHVTVEGERLFFAPSVAELWVVGSEDAAGMTAVIDAIEATLATGPLATHAYAWRELLSGMPFVFRNGAAGLFVPSDDHVMASRLNALVDRVESLRHTSLTAAT